MLWVLAGVVSVPRRTTVYYYCFRAGVGGKPFTKPLVNRKYLASYLLSAVRDFLTTETSSEPDFRLLFTLGMSPVHTQKKTRTVITPVNAVVTCGALYLDMCH